MKDHPDSMVVRVTVTVVRHGCEYGGKHYGGKHYGLGLAVMVGQPHYLARPLMGIVIERYGNFWSVLSRFSTGYGPTCYYCAVAPTVRTARDASPHSVQPGDWGRASQ